MPHCGRVERNNRFCGRLVQKTAISCIPRAYGLACVVPSPSNSLWTSPVPNIKNLFRFRLIQYPHRPHERFSRRMRTKINEFRQILNYVARMHGPQPMKLALDLTRTNTPRGFFDLGRSDIHIGRTNVSPAGANEKQ